MSQQLQIWCEKLKREITPGTPAALRIRLMTVGESTVWQQWEPIRDLDPADWAVEAEALIAGIILDLPKRRVQLVFTAEDHGGAPVATLIRSVTGTNPNAQDLGTQNGAKALADAMTSVGKLMETTLEQARKMLDFQSLQLEKAQENINDAHEFFMAIRKAELTSTEQDGAASQMMIDQVKTAGPMLMTLLGHIVQNAGKQGLGGAAAAAAKATTNGATAS